MNLDEAIEAGLADIDGRLLTLPDIDANGRAIVPYGVRTLGKGCIRFKSKLEYLLLPDSLEELEEEAIHCIVHVKGVATYSHNDDPMILLWAVPIIEGSSYSTKSSFPLLPKSEIRSLVAMALSVLLGTERLTYPKTESYTPTEAKR